jgi:transcription elongation factor Elf1
MGRRRRKVVKIVRRALPQLYLCPRCGKSTVKATINKKQNQASVVCSNCKLNAKFRLTSQMNEVDAYCQFVDNYYSGDKEEEAVVA